MDITNKSLGELKVLAYDAMRTIEVLQRDLNILNSQIEKLQSVETPKEFVKELKEEIDQK